MLALAGSTVATAQAQEDPYVTVEEQAETSQLDTDLTPVAKETDLWTLVHGAEYPETETIEGSVTRFDTDLFAVSFQNRTIGLAGGSECAAEPARTTGEDDPGFGERVANCEGTDNIQRPRVPALYRYTEPADADPAWERLELPGSDEPGYIGAIAWIDSQRALIVGGTGAYPRRELPADGRASTDPAKADVAGDARAWVYHRSSGETEEIDLSTLTADTPASGEAPARAGMRGLSAAACYADPRPEFQETPLELCFAGGLGQIWEWRAGGEWGTGAFTGKRVDARSPEAELSQARLFRHRVREIGFTDLEPPIAAAVTAGCCEADETKNTPRLLVYDHVSDVCSGSSCRREGPPRWFVRKAYDRFGQNTCALSTNESACLKNVSPEANTTAKEPNDRPELPDSFYSLTLSSPSNPSADNFRLSAVATPGGPEDADERPSLITQSYSQQRTGGGTAIPRYADPANDALRTPISTARLLAGDGDVASSDFQRPAGLGAGEGEPDWAVGELRSTERTGLGSQGLLVATALPPRAQEALNEGRPATTPPAADELAQGDYEPVDQERLQAHIRSRHYLLPSYTANAIEIVGAQEDGWAVGDHGAILRLSEKANEAAERASEPKPPRLGAPRQRPLSDRDAYEGSAPALPAAAGTVPGLSGETIALDEPEMVPAGRPGGAVEEIVMSRDGSEGWAIGNAGGPTFIHFDGMSWRRCEPVALEGTQPDPACAAMAPLRGWRDASGNLTTTNLNHVVRIPLENDADPTNDDELEILAIGGSYQGPETSGETLPAVVRYSEGRWRFADPKLARTLPGAIIDVAFTDRDDGWLAARDPNARDMWLYHFNGERWVKCSPGVSECGDPAGRLPPRIADLSGLIAVGRRTYLFGGRQQVCLPSVSVCPGSPLILYRERDGEWTDGSGPGGDAGGFDPGFSNPAAVAGKVEALSVVERPDGDFEGWATGRFEGDESLRFGQQLRVPAHFALMRLEPTGGRGWEPFRSPGAFDDYMLSPVSGFGHSPSNNRLQVSYPSTAHSDGAFIGQRHQVLETGSRLFGFDSARQRFEMLESHRPQGHQGLAGSGRAYPAGSLEAMAPDGTGGFWASVSGYFFHYTDRPSKPVFDEVAHPLRRANLRALTGAPDGSIWAATDSDRLYRRDRTLGWEEVRIEGWDPGRIVTRASTVSAIAFGANGDGVAVGEGGRIADLDAEGVALNPAAGRSCALGDAMPCGTGRDLDAVDVATDGSAIVAGERLALLWRPADGEFRAIQKPAIAGATDIISVSIPTPSRAYLATDAGVIFRGALSGTEWTWRRDNANDSGELISLDSQNRPIVIRDLALDAEGEGLAVGDGGLVMLRSEAKGWRRIPNPYPTDLTAVFRPEAGGESFLIGGENGLVLTGHGVELRVARHADFIANFAQTGDVVGFGYVPGAAEGSFDAWAGIAGTPLGEGDARLLRYRSDPADSFLDPATAAHPLPDAPGPHPGELSLAAFGKSDCDRPEANLCPELSATTTTNEVVSERIIESLASLRKRGEVDLALLSGDAVDSAGLPASSLADLDRVGSVPFAYSSTATAGQMKHRRYAELVVDELDDREIPLFSALGSQDLTENVACDFQSGRCETSKRFANAGENLAWREAFSGHAEPWGDGSDALDTQADGEISFEPAPGSEDNSLRVENQHADIDGDGTLPEAKAEIGGANTHYAVDAIRDGEPIARIVFVDTSLRSLQASDPLQQPHELAGGQQRFLERMICTEGQQSTFGDGCTRGEDQRAIVVSNTPTYSYGPGALTHTALDATTFEATMLRYDVDLVISGALGYNGLYYTLAPGVHEPCPAGEYPQGPPSGNTPDCLAGPTGPAEEARKRVDESPAGGAAPGELSDPASLIEEQGLSGAYPTLIASGAGGKFGPDGTAPPDGPAGQWHGFSLARLLPEGDLVIEQRPILDWIGLDAANHAVSPKSRLTLHGHGRSPLSTTVENENVRAFHYEISNAAITHRYDLLLADPDEPWLPCEEADLNCTELHANLSGASSGEAAAQAGSPEGENSCSPYLCLPSRIGVVDDQSGQVRAGDGKYPETFAIAMLSVDEEVATYPLVFKRSPSFVATPALRSGALPNTAGTRPTAPPPPPPPPGLPQIPQVDIPQIPPPPGIPQLSAATPPELQPPAPPAPPPPSQQPAPLDLSVAPPGVSISTPTALIQPPTPPVNPAPPGGARREARQRQAAAQKGGADSDESAGDANELGGDMADGREGAHGSAATRRAEPGPARQDYSYTRLEKRGGGVSGLPIVAGLTLAAFAMAAGFSTLRPGPRRRTPELPAPAWNRHRGG